MAKLKQSHRQILPCKITRIVVRRRALTDGAHLARLHVGPTTLLAAIGKAGLSQLKREGDGATPTGEFLLRPGLFRSDRMSRPFSLTRLRPTSPAMGWCDDPESFLYNHPLRAGSRQRHERLWREDAVYDLLIPTSHNQRPRIRGGGSAIFVHLARPGYAPTEGCVAIKGADMRRLLPRLGKATRLIVVA